MKNRYLEDLSADRIVTFFTKVCDLFLMIIRELFFGTITGTIPHDILATTGFMIFLGIYFQIDYELICNTRFVWLYPTHPKLYCVYRYCTPFSPYFLWLLVLAGRRIRFAKKLDNIFLESGLKNSLGKTPKLISDYPIDRMTRKLTVTRSSLAMSEFKAKQNSIEGGLNIYIDDYKEIRDKGRVDIIYSYEPMPDLSEFDRIEGLKPTAFFIGDTRSGMLKGDLLHSPHLLVAGQTGGGKSTFLRQLITTLYLNDPSSHFTLIDLKGGLEFQLFSDLERIEVIGSVDSAVTEVGRIARQAEARMKLLRANRCKDIEQYASLPEQKRIKIDGEEQCANLHRRIIIVDEAAELFLASSAASGQQVQAAKASLSQIARQGRSIGMHLVIATQRPDTRALDSQIKANLTGVLCFQMANDTSSVIVLGVGRASDLPSIPGRAIWKSGLDLIEVQVPLLDPNKAAVLLGKTD